MKLHGPTFNLKLKQATSSRIFLRKTCQHTKCNKHYFSLGRMKTNNIRLIKASIYKHRSLQASCLYLEGYTIDSWTVYSLII